MSERLFTNAEMAQIVINNQIEARRKSLRVRLPFKPEPPKRFKPRLYWNTFYQQWAFAPDSLKTIRKLSYEQWVEWAKLRVKFNELNK
ncbi:hypothetical protein [Xanthomonas phage XAJ2]|uniref:Uncharacterized protein n=1 Tax=Xanthomonas phage XAJ2 TaxID=1775249 RepID=A0A1I9L2I9_9CAUD|nr:hypothetical protein [Xanthomonas phage XAJ2]